MMSFGKVYQKPPATEQILYALLKTEDQKSPASLEVALPIANAIGLHLMTTESGTVVKVISPKKIAVTTPIAHSSKFGVVQQLLSSHPNVSFVESKPDFKIC
eukprot:TRINITY_DN3172_c0_g1_i1.p1 TRINITY_DN3172_c0_g1~~TRINITY_DN3172_c0_g1_i1.p1  ORF type:complete len:102 (+),score=15.02 TRINITY_DN3172_c0_g1_i1:114-419(+)